MMSLPLRRESVSHNIFVWEDKIVGWWKLLDVEDTTGGLCNCDWQPRWRMIPLLDTLLPAYLLSNYCPQLLQPPPHTGKQGGGRGGAGRAGHQPTFLLLLLASCHSLSTIYYLELSSHTVWLCVEHASHGHYDVSRSRNDRSQFSSFHLIVFLQWLVNGRLSTNFCSLIGSSICIYCKCVFHGQWIQTTIYLSTLDIIYIYLS